MLARVSGAARPREVCAVLGPSGAGKSTLLDILAARKSQGSLSGEVLVNGRPRDAAAFRARTAYVPQARARVRIAARPAAAAAASTTRRRRAAAFA